MTNYSATSGSPVSNTTINGGDALYVYAGGTATTDTINSGGSATVYSGGYDAGNVVNSFGYLRVSSGGSASGNLVNSNGVQDVVSGGTDTGSTVYGGGMMIVYGVANNDVVSGILNFFSPIEDVNSGGIASGALVGSGGVINEGRGGTTFDTVISGGLDQVGLSNDFNDPNAIPLAISATVLSGGRQTVNSRGLTSSTSIGSGGSQVVNFSGLASGTIVSGGGQQYISSGGIASGTQVSSGGSEVVASGGTATGTTLIAGGSIDLNFLSFVSGSPGPSLDQNDVLSVTEGGSSYQQQLVGNYTSEYFHAAPGPVGVGTVITLDNNPCYCRGTRIAKTNGQSPVEALRIGDMVVTRSGAARSIKWIGHRAYDPRFISGNRNILPIVFKAGALAEGVPARDLHVSPKHAMFLNDVLIPAERLVNGRSVVQLDTVAELTYFHIELDTHDILLAEGAQSESFVDCDSRNMFQNVHEFAALYPDSPGESWRFCAERVESGPEVDAARALLAERADALGLPTIASQTLHLTTAGTVTATVAAGVVELSLRSPSKIPSGEYRRLGAAFTALRLDGVAIDLDHPSLGRGFHPTEREDGRVWRWSDGEGVLRIEPAPHSRKLTISLDCVLLDALDSAA